MSDMFRAYFRNDAADFTNLDSVVRLEGVVCPHCGVVDGRIYEAAGVRDSISKNNSQGVIRHGLKKCAKCPQQFTVKVGAFFEPGREPAGKLA